MPGESVGALWLNRKQAADYLSRVGCPLSYRALEYLARNGNAGNGPPFTKINAKGLRYHQDDLREWANKTARRFV